MKKNKLTAQQQHALALREAEKTSSILVRRELRNLRARLKRLTGSVKQSLEVIDKEMRQPSIEHRGKRIAIITNWLEIENDSAIRFGLK